MARNSKLCLAHIDIPGNHCFAFANNAARDSWFDGRTHQAFEQLTFIREENIQLPANINNILQYNFGYFFNEVGQRIYFRVTDMTYIGEQNTMLTIEKDVLMTYLPTSTMLPSFVERSNEEPSSIFDSDVPELQYNGGFTHSLLDQFATTTNFDFFVQQGGSSDPDTQTAYWTKVNTKNFNNDTTVVMFPSRFQFMDDPADFATVVNIYAQNGTADRILSAGVLPADDYTQTLEDGGTVEQGSILTCVRNTKAVSVGTSLNKRIAKDNVSVIIAEIDNFANQIEIPISELSGGSITLVSVSDPISQQRHYGLLSGADGDNELKYRITINVGASLPAMNLPYYMAMRNIETDLSAQQTNNLIGGGAGVITGAGQGALAGGAIGGPGGALIGAITGGAGAAMSTATNAIQNQVSANAALEKAKRLAPTVSGTLSGFGIFANRSLGVNIFLKEPSGSGLSQFLDYYRFFGYNKSRIITPNVKSGTRFYMGNVNGNFPGASATDTNTIRSLFTTGVWIWTNEAGQFNY